MTAGLRGRARREGEAACFPAIADALDRAAALRTFGGA